MHIGRGSGPGAFNVGLVYWNKKAKEALDLWVYCVNTKDNPYEKVYGRCGDQAYLELIEQKYGAHIFSSFLTSAPWTSWIMEYKDLVFHNIKAKLNSFADTTIHFSKDFLPLLYHHFVGFALTENGYTPTRERFEEKYIYGNEGQKFLYEDYFLKHKNLK